uniref:SPC3 n=1 Tax=Neogobius melanostomus TaxID=47308 RepID=A0A8C6UGX8_9GOBI
MTCWLFVVASVSYLGAFGVHGQRQRDVLTNHWAVRVTGGPFQADRVAAKYGYRNLGQIGSLKDHYHFHHSRVVRRAAYSFRGTHSFIHMDPQVQWAEQQRVRTREKRSVQSDPSFNFNDPKWSSMWYIHCNDKSSPCRSDMNILGAWQRGFTGKNVVVTILDDGIERNHPDLAPNYDHLASYDVNDNDYDPTPRYDFRNENIHGTRCAGEVAAAANNSHCIVGVAFNAHIGGIRMLDGDVTDLVEAKSLGIRPDYIDIYSSSWGPKDDGRTVDGPGPLTKRSFEQGIKKGRKGLGSIFVWASGNGGRQFDHCSCDGYTNSIYTVSISSTTEHGNRPWYLEPCSAILATTYSRGELNDRKIVTTDLRQSFWRYFAHLLLTWRDVQHLLVKTSRPLHLSADDWKSNAAGLRVSHLYGFGLVDAEAMVREASKWRTVPPQHVCSHRPVRTLHPPCLHSSMSLGCSDEADRQVNFLEHVVVSVLLTHPRRGDLQIHLMSPSGTRSQLLAKRLYDSSNEGFRNWEFMSVHFWGEKAEGLWTLEIKDSPSKLRNTEVLGKACCILTCASHCPLGYFEDVGAHRCRRCHKNCERCLGRTQTECVSCRRGLYKSPLSSSCVHACPEGFYGHESEYTCLKCHDRCSGCLNDSDRCTACKQGYSLAGMTCVPQCTNGTFFHLEEMSCSHCHPSCQTCTGPGKEECIRCAEGLLQQEWRCVRSCGPGYYSGQTSGDRERRCHRCEENCLSCSGQGTTCLRCKDGYILVSRTCVINSSCNNGK